MRDYLLRTKRWTTAYDGVSPALRVFEEKGIRRVRTPEGAEKYGLPIGSIIVRDEVPTVPASVRSRAARLSGRTTDASRARAAKRTVSARKPAPAAAQTPAKRTAPKTTLDYSAPMLAEIVPDRLPGLTPVESEYEDWEKFRDDDGNDWYIGRDGRSWVVHTSDDEEIGRARSRDAAMAKLNEHLGLAGGSGRKPMVRMRPATNEDRKRLRIPPAWTDVQINMNPNATLVARGRDNKGRVQSIYSADHTANQAAAKFQRIQVLMEHIDKLDAALERDALVSEEAAALTLIRKLGMRPGSNQNTGADQQAFGATNLRAKHVKVTPGGQTNLSFVGKKGVNISLKTKDPLIYEIMAERLQTRSRNMPMFDTNESRVRSYMRQHLPEEFQLKDLRTLRANVIALAAVERVKRGKPKTKTEFRRKRREVAQEVSAQLGNTPAVALSAYINPVVFDPWVLDEEWL